MTVDGVTHAAPEPVLPARDGQPDRVRGHLPAAGGAARPLPAPDRARLSRRDRGAAHPRGAALRPPARAPAAGRRPRGRPGAARGGAARVRRRGAAQLDRRPRPLDARARGRLDRQLRPRQPRGRARRARLGAPERPRLRRPRGRRAALRARARAPRRLHARARRPRARRPAGPLRSRSSGWRASSSLLAPAPTRTRCSTSGPSRPARQPRLERRQPDLPARPPPPPDRPDPRHDAERSPRPRHRGRRLASVPPGRRHPLDRLGCLGAPLVRARAATSSSSASATRTRGRGSSSSPTAGPSSPSSRRRCRGSTRARRCGRRSRSCSRAPPAPEGSSATSTTRTASPYWLPPRGERRLAHVREERLDTAGWGAPADGVERSLEHLFEHRRQVTAGSFVFVLSDFLDAPSRETWLTAVEHLWDVVPVVIQDPTWEQSFPDVSGIVVPLRDARSGRVDARPADQEGGGRAEARARGAARGRCSTSSPCSISIPS